MIIVPLLFSPQGNLFQVTYAMEAIRQAASCVGILSKDGVVIAAEKRFDSKLLDIRNKTEKMYQIDDHIAIGVAGITSDANSLINYCRVEAQRYLYTYQEPIPLEHLIQILCDLKQSYTQFGGLRPYGVSFLFAGWDKQHGYQLYHSDPSGNYGGWKAKAIGANNNAASMLLKDDYKDNLSLHDAQQLALKVLSKTMDTSSPSVDKIEFSTITQVNNQVKWHVLNK